MEYSKTGGASYLERVEGRIRREEGGGESDAPWVADSPVRFRAEMADGRGAAGEVEVEVEVCPSSRVETAATTEAVQSNRRAFGSREG